MSDYIKREDAMKAICKRCLIENDICQHHWNCPYLGEIGQVASIDVVPKDFHDKTCEAMAKRHTEEIQMLMPKRGEWISLHNGKWKCSECGIEVLIYAKGNFCLNCGCAMTTERQRLVGKSWMDALTTEEQAELLADCPWL